MKKKMVKKAKKPMKSKMPMKGMPMKGMGKGH